MGLEITGFAKPNLDQLWIPPEDYRVGLEAAVTRLATAGLNADLQSSTLQFAGIPLAFQPAVNLGLEERVPDGMRSVRSQIVLWRILCLELESSASL